MTTENELTRMKKAMENTEKILPKILRALPVPDLKECRRVSKSWLKLTSDFLLNKDCLFVQLSYSDRGNLFFHPSSSVSREYDEDDDYDDEDLTYFTRTLLDLTDLLARSSSSFPCTHYMFHCGYVGHYDLVHFFSQHGHLVKKLSMAYMCDEDWLSTGSAQAFRYILNTTMPNLTDLTISGFDFQWTATDKIELPKLTNFRCGDSSVSIATKILAGTPNLKNLQGLTLAHVDMIVRQKKISAMKELALFNGTKTENILSFIQAPRVTGQQQQQQDGEGVQYMAFCLDHIRGHPTKQVFEEVITKLLNFVKDSLEILILGQLPSLLHVKLPIFSKLEILRLGPMAGSQAHRCFKIFPDNGSHDGGTEVWQHFPTLQELDFSTIDSTKDENWDICFPSSCASGDGGGMMMMTGNFKTVQKIQFSCPVTERWLQGFQKFCPNVKTLIITCLPGGKEPGNLMRLILPRIFQLWPNLEHIDVKMKEMTDDGPLFTLDPVLLMKKTVENFQVNQEEPSTHLGLKELKSLKFWFLKKFTPSTFPFSTQMARVYGVKLMSADLKVTVVFDHGWYSMNELKTIQELAGPYVNIEHWKR